MDRRGVLTAVLVFGGLFALCFLFAASLIAASDDGAALHWGSGPRIGVVEVEGVIRDPRPALEALETFRRDEDVAAIVVRIDSPGGAVGPSQEVYRSIRRARKTKKVVASLGAVAASGGYYIASAADRIVASSGTVTGSIGVITQLAQVHELLALAHIQTETFKSGPLKDSGSPFRPMSDADRRHFQGVVDDIYRQFVRDVAEARGVPVDEVKAVADGRVLTGEQARSFKLVDEIGGFHDALDRAAKLAGKKGDPVPVYPPRHRKLSFLAELLEELGTVLGRWADNARLGGAEIEVRDPYLAPR